MMALVYFGVLCFPRSIFETTNTIYALGNPGPYSGLVKIAQAILFGLGTVQFTLAPLRPA